MPQFLISEHDYGKRYVVVVKNVPLSQRFFYNHLCRNSLFRNIIMESGINGIGIWVEVTRFGGDDEICEIAGVRIGDA